MTSPPVTSPTENPHVTTLLTSHSLSPAQFSLLSSSSASAKATAYCPYSSFRVGCAILTHSGEIITGANVENAAYPVGTCAERVALGKAVTAVLQKEQEDREKNGEEGTKRSSKRSSKTRKWPFKALGVSTDISPPASPCGMCRQFIREFCELNMPIFMFDKDGNFVVCELGELLPMSFGPEALPGGR